MTTVNLTAWLGRSETVADSLDTALAGRIIETGVAELWAGQDGTLAHQAQLRLSS